ncbi:hypothetical protein PS3A_16010 [Pseudomonas sp. 3A(2025)]
MSRYALVNVSTKADWHAYHRIRRQVLWEQRGRNDYNTDLPDEQATANHPLLLKLDGHPIGTTRLDNDGSGRGIVRLVAISLAAQRQGHGRALSTLVEGYARSLGLEVLLVNAALDAVGFYEKMGWKIQVWDKAEHMSGVQDCVQMIKSLIG